MRSQLCPSLAGTVKPVLVKRKDFASCGAAGFSTIATKSQCKEAARVLDLYWGGSVPEWEAHLITDCGYHPNYDGGDTVGFAVNQGEQQDDDKETFLCNKGGHVVSLLR